jgi:hypothetical protein
MKEQDATADLDELLENVEQVEESTVQPEQAEAEPVEIPEELQPVSAWKEEARQAWESLAANAEYHDGLKKLRGQFDSDYQYRTQLEQERAQLSQQAQAAERFQQIAQKYDGVLQGRNPMEVAEQLFWYSQRLAQDPANTIQQLAQQYGVDLKQVTQDQPYVDEYTQQLQGQMSAMQQQFQEWQASQQQERNRQVIEKAKAFEFETDAEGNLLRPHVAEVADDMLRLMQAGYAQDFQDAYERACWANPAVREKLMKQQESGKKLQQKEQAQKAKAAAAAQPKPGKSSVTAPKGVEDLDDALDQALQDAAA